MTENSFNFNTKNSVDDFGIYVISVDQLMPPKVVRKQYIPNRSGMYDFGSQTYSERTLRLSCYSDKTYTRAEFREVVFWLSKKSKLYLFSEEEKYYTGEMFVPPNITSQTLYRLEPFLLEFVCEPFAYKEVGIQSLTQGTNSINYKGTSCTPCTIIVKNPNAFAVTGLQLVSTRRKS